MTARILKIGLTDPGGGYRFGVMKKAMMMKFPGRVFCLAAPCLLLCCAGPTSLDPMTGNVQIQQGSADLRGKGDEAFATYRRTHAVSSDAAKTARVMRVATRLQEVIRVPGTTWQFTVFNDSEANAFAVPGGKVGVNTGLLDVATTDGMLAAVLAHEMAHVTSNHAQARVQRQQTIGLGSAVLGGLLGEAGQGANYKELSQVGGQLVFGLPFSRGQELEADKVGMIFMARAGYDPAEAVTLWQAMAARGGSQQSEILSTHPVNATRIQQLQEFLPIARQQQR